MKKTLALLAAPVVMLAASAATATHWGVTPYVGADAEWRQMDFQRGFGDNLFNHNYPQGNIYVGAKFNEYVAVEAGYEASERKTRTSNLQGGDVSAGVPIPAGIGIRYNSTSQIKGLHADLVGTFPIYEPYRLQLIGMVGFARLNSSQVITSILVTSTLLPPVADNSSINFKARKTVLRLGAGLQHMINCDWGVRAIIKWEQSNKLKMNGIENSLAQIKAKNSVIYSLGAFYTFN